MALSLAPGAAATTLQEAIDIAIESHPTVQASRALRRSAIEDVNDAHSGYLPTLDVKVESGPEHANTSSTRGRSSRRVQNGKAGVNVWNKSSEVTVTQMLFDGFDTPSRTRAAKRRVTVARHQLFDSRETIGLRVAQAYLQVLRNRLVLKLAEENLQQHERIHADVTARAEGGEGDEADVHQAKARLELSRSRVVQTRGDLRDSETDYLEAVGSMPDELEMPAGRLEALPKDLDDAVAKALDANPAVLAAVSTVQARRFDIDAADSEFWPTVDVELTYTREEDTGGVRGPSLDAKALVVMRYNLYQGGQDLARRRRAVEQSQEAVQREGETRRLVEEQMRLDFNDFSVTAERIPILEDRVSASRDAVATYREQFDLGRRSLLDVLDVENELFQAKVDLVDGQIGNLFAQYKVLSSMGALLNTLDIPLGDDADETGEQMIEAVAN